MFNHDVKDLFNVSHFENRTFSVTRGIINSNSIVKWKSLGRLCFICVSNNIGMV
jgi:hypothetical protein